MGHLHRLLPLSLDYDRCPMRLLKDPAVIAALRLHQHVQRYGVLPAAGGLDNQVNRDVEALDCITVSLARHQAPAREEG